MVVHLILSVSSYNFGKVWNAASSMLPCSLILFNPMSICFIPSDQFILGEHRILKPLWQPYCSCLVFH